MIDPVGVEILIQHVFKDLVWLSMLISRFFRANDGEKPPSLCSYIYEWWQGYNENLDVPGRPSCFGIRPQHCGHGIFHQSATEPLLSGHSNPPSDVSGSCNRHWDAVPAAGAASEHQNCTYIDQ